MRTELAPLERIATAGVLPVVEIAQVADAAPLLEALLEGGLDALEITLRTEAALDVIRLLCTRYPEALIGAGTVRSTADAQRALDAGAAFVVSPGVDTDVVEVSRDAGVPVVPGACTPTEVQIAVRAGADAVKFFPAEPMGGAAFLRALIAPFRDARFIPTGGITPENLADYLRLPQVIACGGSWLAPPALVREGRFERIAELAREAVVSVAEARNA